MDFWGVVSVEGEVDDREHSVGEERCHEGAHSHIDEFQESG